MTVPTGWTLVPIWKLEDEKITMQQRYSLSIPMREIVSLRDQKHECITRDGLGVWNMIALRSAEAGVLLFGCPAHESDVAGASVWTSLELSLDEITSVVRMIGNNADISVVVAE